MIKFKLRSFLRRFLLSRHNVSQLFFKKKLIYSEVILLIWPLWALMNSAVSSPTLGAIFFFKGLFSQCVQYMPGQYQCDNGLRPLFLKTPVTICMQSFAIISQVFLGISLALQLFGMECSKCFFRVRFILS